MGRSCPPPRLSLWATSLCAALVLGGCSSGNSHARAEERVVEVVERDFRIEVSTTRIPAGDVVISVANRGPVRHELILVRTGQHTLPFRKDGITVDEEALTTSTVGALEPGRVGDVRQLHLRLNRGRYMMLCNMAGHYLGGMRAELVVT